MADKTLTIDDLHEYQALKKHIREHLDDYDVDDIEKKRFERFMWDTDREVNALLDRAKLERQKNRALLQMYWSFWFNINQRAKEFEYESPHEN